MIEDILWSSLFISPIVLLFTWGRLRQGDTNKRYDKETGMLDPSTIPPPKTPVIYVLLVSYFISLILVLILFMLL